MEQKNIQQALKNDEISIKEIIDILKKYWSYLLSKWLIILIVGLSGGALGLVVSIMKKPTYTANLSFALVEKSSNGGGLADLASSFGFSGLIGGNSGAFSGDNLLEIIKSRYAVENTLLTTVEYKGSKKRLIEIFIDFSELRDKWKKNKNKELHKLSYPIEQKRETFTRTQDSVLFTIYDNFNKTQALTITRKDKKISIVNVDFVSKDELFSKLFVEELMNQTYRFYKQTKTSQSRANITMMQHTADSIKNLYEGALYKGAGYSQVNINPALQIAAVPRIKQENNAQLYGAVYAEVLKNLETLKLDLARETPLVQMIDEPILPLKKDKLGKLKGIIYGGSIGGMLIFLFLIGNLYLKQILKN